MTSAVPRLPALWLPGPSCSRLLGHPSGTLCGGPLRGMPGRPRLPNFPHTPLPLGPRRGGSPCLE